MMRSWMIVPVAAVLLAIGGAAALSLTWGQEAPAPAPGAEPGVLGHKPAVSPPAPSTITKLPPDQRQAYLAAQAGTHWLLRLCQPNGRFLYGLVPELRVPLQDDNFVHQAAAAFALARSAQFYHGKEDKLSDSAAAAARQALLTLLLETATDAQSPQVRYPLVNAVDPRAAAAWLVLAISELPQPGADLVKQSQELCQYLRGQQKNDGSFNANLKSADPKLEEAAWATPGLVMYALARGLPRGGDTSRWDLVRKARDFYQSQWLSHKNTALIPWCSAACVEAYLATKEPAFAQCATDMNDWLCTLQCNEIQKQNVLFNGGFKKWSQGTVSADTPDVHSAVFLEGLAQGCRLARERGDLTRYQSYRQALEFCGRFLLTLQYTEANAQHFESEYRRDFLLGGFHATHQSGLLRLDYTQEAVSGLVKYLAEVAEVK